MTIAQVNQYYLKVLKPLCVVQSSSHLYIKALSIKERTGYGWYDSIIIASALEASCSILYSEDLQDQQIIENVRIVNPFAMHKEL